MGEVCVGIEQAIEQIARGRMVVVVDAADRENEGDLVVAAELITAETVNFMARWGRGLICLALTPDRCDHLGLSLLPRRNGTSFDTAFTVSIEARHGVTTGISAHDRARTIQAAVDPDSTPDDLVRPGHVFPLRARRAGVLERPGHTEAAVDLARMAGMRPAGVICEILNDNGTMARVPELENFCHRHGLCMVTIADLVAYRRRHERLVERIASARLPTDYGEFRIVGYRERQGGKEHVALVKGDVAAKPDVLVRLHSQCLTGDAFGSARCDCGGQLQDAMRRIADEDAGVLVHLAQEGRDIGLVDKIRAYELQDSRGLDTVDANLALGKPADARDFGVGAQILVDLGLSTVRLMSNNLKKAAALEHHGLTVLRLLPLERRPSPENLDYLRTKRDRLGHRLAQIRQTELATLSERLAEEDQSWLPSLEMAV